MHFNSKSHQKKIQKTSFRGVELIRVEVMKSRETYVIMIFKKKFIIGLGMFDYN